MEIDVARTREEIQACFPVIHELRTHLSEEPFIAQVERQMANHGYTLVYLHHEGNIIAAAGYRIAEYLAWGRTLYIDDLITRSQNRHLGAGNTLLDWLFEQANTNDCNQIHLDSGVQRHDAHRLYLKKGMIISSHHFSKQLT